MRQLLLINPNTSAAMSERLACHVQRAVGAQVRIKAVTARFGAPYIACEASYAVAAHATLDAWAWGLSEAGYQPDAVLIGCFGDPGLMALREVSQVPVTGLAEASFAHASLLGRFAIVTGGDRWQPILSRLAHSLGHGAQLAGIHTVSLTGAELARAPALACQVLTQACQEVVNQYAVQSIILGGAGLAGLAMLVAPHVDIPVLDSVQAGAHYALREAVAVSAQARLHVAWHRLSPELTARGSN